MTEEQGLWRFEEIGVLVAANVGLIICETCGGGIEFDLNAVIELLRKAPHHGSSATARTFYRRAQEILENTTVDKELQSLYREKSTGKYSSKPRPRLPGIPVTEVFKCLYCPHFVSCLKTLAKHIRGAEGHAQGAIVSERGLEAIKPVKGQTFWRSTKQRFYYPIGTNPVGFGGGNDETDGAAHMDCNILSALKAVRDAVKHEEPEAESVETRTMKSFAEMIRLDLQLKNMRIPWDLATKLASG